MTYDDKTIDATMELFDAIEASIQAAERLQAPRSALRNQLRGSTAIAIFNMLWPAGEAKVFLAPMRTGWMPHWLHYLFHPLLHETYCSHHWCTEERDEDP